MNRYHSWGLYPKISPKKVKKIFWRNESSVFENCNKVLPFGLGRSYGDVCLVDNGILIDTTELKHLIRFDQENGILHCESGVTLEQILKHIVPKGWFLPVTPGTKYITVGGAIANDVHGKNHHKAGSFGHYVKSFDLLRSDGSIVHCSPEENPELFQATIGGLGLTGLILNAEFTLKKIPSEYLYLQTIKFKSISEFFEINDASEKNFEYTVAWVDLTNGSLNSVRGIYQRANHFFSDQSVKQKKSKISIPFVLPFSLINNLSIFIFNALYYSKQFDKYAEHIIHYDPFFYPLDGVNNWNYLYGRKGFLQYQFVIPKDNCERNLLTILNEIKKLGLSSFLTVLKTFGNKPKAGILSFPREGLTLAIDFPITQDIFQKLNKLDSTVVDFGGALYPAKDARMSSKIFHESYPEVNNFLQFKDPLFNSAFWERVMSC
ncbi:MAG: Putative oxidoreductase [Candidatus Kapaibacterium sp.]|nr:MAG: Putative oxidoreductase [Candidatus Kapabacteria bacterium]